MGLFNSITTSPDLWACSIQLQLALIYGLVQFNYNQPWFMGFFNSIILLFYFTMIIWNIWNILMQSACAPFRILTTFAFN